MIPRPVIARLHRINRNRRNVAVAARIVRFAFRLVPPILWDWTDGYLRDLERRTDDVLFCAAMARAPAVLRRSGLCRWTAGRSLTWLFGLTSDEGCRYAT